MLRGGRWGEGVRWWEGYRGTYATVGWRWCECLLKTPEGKMRRANQGMTHNLKTLSWCWLRAAHPT